MIRILFLTLLFPTTVLAESALHGFVKFSADKSVRARLVANPWTVQVSERTQDGYRKRLWSSTYRHPGDNNVLIADNGCCVIHVAPVFREDEPLIEIYSRGDLTRTIYGRGITFDRAALKGDPSKWLLGQWMDAKGHLYVITADGNTHRWQGWSGADAPLPKQPVAVEFKQPRPLGWPAVWQIKFELASHLPWKTVKSDALYEAHLNDLILRVEVIDMPENNKEQKWLKCHADNKEFSLVMRGPKTRFKTCESMGKSPEFARPTWTFRVE